MKECFTRIVITLLLLGSVIWECTDRYILPPVVNDLRLSIFHTEPMNVLFTFSGDPFNVMPSIYSVINNNPGEIIHFFIISPTKETLNENKKMLEGINIPNVSFTYGVSSDHYYRKQKQLYGYNTFLRLHFPIEFPDVERFLYLDGDTLVLRDISRFYYQPFYDNYVIAIKDYNQNYEPQYKPYFNGGVLVMNSAKYLRDNIFEKIMKFFDSSEEPIKNRDQSAMNYAFGKHKIIEDMSYNTWRRKYQKYAHIFHFYIMSKPKINMSRPIYVDNLWRCYWDLYNNSINPWKENRFNKSCVFE